MDQSTSNEDIKHTAGAEMPESRPAGRLLERARADLPAYRSMLGSRKAITSFVISTAAVGISWLLYRNSFRKSGVARPLGKLKSAFSRL